MATHSLRLLMAASVAAVACMGANAQEQPKQKKAQTLPYTAVYRPMYFSPKPTKK